MTLDRDDRPELASGDSPDGVGFLTSLLMLYPEVGSACLRDRGRHLQLEFYLRRGLEPREFPAFSEDLRTSVEVVHHLKRLAPCRFEVELQDRHEGGDEPTSIRVVRDVESLTVEELSVAVAVVAEHFPDELLGGEEAEPEESSYQEDLLSHTLERIRGSVPEINLFGFRDDMRVLVYASDRPPREIR